MTVSPVAEPVGSLDRSGSTPLYIQLANVLREKIERGEWKPDQKIPSENELNRMYGISRMTARQVLAQLVNEELLFRVQGKGTFVAHRKIGTRSPAYMGIREQLERMGYETTTKVLSSEVIPADVRVAEHLRISPGSLVYRLSRVRLVEDEPISLHTSFVPKALAQDLDADDLVNRQLCVVLENEHGLRMSRVNESLESTLPSADEAKLLRIRRTTPLLLLRQEISDPTGQEFEYSRILFRGDKIRLEFQYEL
ncbi:MAG TPA: GntR family transcriptional regulator [Nakamurella multipartita]|jgi:GntR family transcriptional regulator|nr:GntR family transcriptional regulator [Nakamurella multipartita]